MSEVKLPEDHVLIEKLGLSFRTHRILKAHGCKTVGDVKRIPDFELHRMRGMGERSFREARGYCPYQADALTAAQSEVWTTGGKVSEMSLRAHYAGIALKAVVTSKVETELMSCDQIADYCVSMADAMIKRLAKIGGGGA